MSETFNNTVGVEKKEESLNINSDNIATYKQASRDKLLEDFEAAPSKEEEHSLQTSQEDISEREAVKDEMLEGLTSEDTKEDIELEILEFDKKLEEEKIDSLEATKKKLTNTRVEFYNYYETGEVTPYMQNYWKLKGIENEDADYKRRDAKQVFSEATTRLALEDFTSSRTDIIAAKYTLDKHLEENWQKQDLVDYEENIAKVNNNMSVVQQTMYSHDEVENKLSTVDKLDLPTEIKEEVKATIIDEEKRYTAHSKHFIEGFSRVTAQGGSTKLDKSKGELINQWFIDNGYDTIQKQTNFIAKLTLDVAKSAGGNEEKGKLNYAIVKLGGAFFGLAESIDEFSDHLVGQDLASGLQGEDVQLAQALKSLRDVIKDAGTGTLGDRSKRSVRIAEMVLETGARVAGDIILTGGGGAAIGGASKAAARTAALGQATFMGLQPGLDIYEGTIKNSQLSNTEVSKLKAWRNAILGGIAIGGIEKIQARGLLKLIGRGQAPAVNLTTKVSKLGKVANVGLRFVQGTTASMAQELTQDAIQNGIVYYDGVTKGTPGISFKKDVLMAGSKDAEGYQDYLMVQAALGMFMGGAPASIDRIAHLQNFVSAEGNSVLTEEQAAEVDAAETPAQKEALSKAFAEENLRESTDEREGDTKIKYERSQEELDNFKAESQAPLSPEDVKLAEEKATEIFDTYKTIAKEFGVVLETSIDKTSKKTVYAVNNKTYLDPYEAINAASVRLETSYAARQATTESVVNQEMSFEEVAKEKIENNEAKIAKAEKEAVENADIVKKKTQKENDRVEGINDRKKARAQKSKKEVLLYKDTVIYDNELKQFNETANTIRSVEKRTLMQEEVYKNTRLLVTPLLAKSATNKLMKKGDGKNNSIKLAASEAAMVAYDKLLNSRQKREVTKIISNLINIEAILSDTYTHAQLKTERFNDVLKELLFGPIEDSGITIPVDTKTTMFEAGLGSTSLTTMREGIIDSITEVNDLLAVKEPVINTKAYLEAHYPEMNNPNDIELTIAKPVAKLEKNKIKHRLNKVKELRAENVKIQQDLKDQQTKKERAAEIRKETEKKVQSFNAEVKKANERIQDKELSEHYVSLRRLAELKTLHLRGDATADAIQKAKAALTASLKRKFKKTELFQEDGKLADFVNKLEKLDNVQTAIDTITSEAENTTAEIIFNKLDIIKERGKRWQQLATDIERAIEYPTAEGDIILRFPKILLKHKGISGINQVIQLQLAEYGANPNLSNLTKINNMLNVLISDTDKLNDILSSESQKEINDLTKGHEEYTKDTVKSSGGWKWLPAGVQSFTQLLTPIFGDKHGSRLELNVNAASSAQHTESTNFDNVYFEKVGSIIKDKAKAFKKRSKILKGSHLVNNYFRKKLKINKELELTISQVVHILATIDTVKRTFTPDKQKAYMDTIAESLGLSNDSTKATLEGHKFLSDIDTYVKNNPDYAINEVVEGMKEVYAGKAPATAEAALMNNEAFTEMDGGYYPLILSTKDKYDMDNVKGDAKGAMKSLHQIASDDKSRTTQELNTKFSLLGAHQVMVSSNARLAHDRNTKPIILKIISALTDINEDGETVLKSSAENAFSDAQMEVFLNELAKFGGYAKKDIIEGGKWYTLSALWKSAVAVATLAGKPITSSLKQGISVLLGSNGLTSAQKLDYFEALSNNQSERSLAIKKALSITIVIEARTRKDGNKRTQDIGVSKFSDTNLALNILSDTNTTIAGWGLAATSMVDVWAVSNSVTARLIATQPDHVLNKIATTGKIPNSVLSEVNSFVNNTQQTPHKESKSSGLTNNIFINMLTQFFTSQITIMGKLKTLQSQYSQTGDKKYKRQAQEVFFVNILTQAALYTTMSVMLKKSGMLIGAFMASMTGMDDDELERIMQGILHVSQADQYRMALGALNVLPFLNLPETMLSLFGSQLEGDVTPFDIVSIPAIQVLLKEVEKTVTKQNQIKELNDKLTYNPDDAVALTRRNMHRAELGLKYATFIIPGLQTIPNFVNQFYYKDITTIAIAYGADGSEAGQKKAIKEVTKYDKHILELKKGLAEDVEGMFRSGITDIKVIVAEINKNEKYVNKLPTAEIQKVLSKVNAKLVVEKTDTRIKEFVAADKHEQQRILNKLTPEEQQRLVDEAKKYVNIKKMANLPW